MGPVTLYWLIICSRRSSRFITKDDDTDSDSDSDFDEEEQKLSVSNKKSVEKEKAVGLYHWFGWFFFENMDNYKKDKYCYARKPLIVNTFLALFDINCIAICIANVYITWKICVECI